MTTETERETAARVTRAWLEGAQTLIAGYGEQLRRMAELGSAFFPPRWPSQIDTRETIERLAQGTREVANAQVEVVGEWLRVPLWLSGAASPLDLQARYARLAEARRELAHTYVDAALGWQRAVSGAIERAAEVAQESVDPQTRMAKAVVNDPRETQQASVEPSRDVAQCVIESSQRAAEQVQQTAERVVEQARDVAKEAAERAELAQQPIKGNVNREGARIYHMPGQANYDRVEAEFRFETEEQAQAAGFRASQR